jgi:hypothetical protein
MDATCSRTDVPAVKWCARQLEAVLIPWPTTRRHVTLGPLWPFARAPVCQGALGGLPGQPVAERRVAQAVVSRATRLATMVAWPYRARACCMLRRRCGPCQTFLCKCCARAWVDSAGGLCVWVRLRWAISCGSHSLVFNIFSTWAPK